MGEEGFHFCFLTTKTYDIEPTLKEYKKIIDKSDWLVILQNGIGNEDLVKEYVPKSRIIRAITSNGAFLVEPGKVEHTGKGFTKIGLPFPNAIEERGEESNKNEDLGLLRKLLTENDIKTTISENIIKDCWEKIFVNIGINPFGALTRLKNGGLMENKDIKTIMGEAVEEATQVANQKGINLSNKNFVNLTYSVARKTQDNVNSMLQDILKGKQTEIDFINGKIVQYAEELGIDVPINRTLTHLIKGLENSSL
jgi:2-dehydropantoate 2-reductase